MKHFEPLVTCRWFVTIIPQLSSDFVARVADDDVQSLIKEDEKGGGVIPCFKAITLRGQFEGAEWNWLGKPMGSSSRTVVKTVRKRL